MIKGIRISDSKENVLTVTLTDILEEISEEDLLWSIQFVDGISNIGESDFLTKYEKEVNQSKNGIFTTKNELKSLSHRYFQMYETIVLASKKINELRRYSTEKEMFESCDIVIVLVDVVFWEVFSRDAPLLEKLRRKFQETKELII